MNKITGFFKELAIGGKIGVVVVFFLLLWGGKVAWEKWMPKPTIKSAVIAVNDLPPLAYDKNANAPSRPIPGTLNLSEVAAPFQLRAEIMGWNAQAGVAYANGLLSSTSLSIAIFDAVV